MGEYVESEPRAGDGIEQMIVPEGYQELVAEIGASAKVCNALFMLLTADNGLQQQHDRAINSGPLGVVLDATPAAGTCHAVSCVKEV
jgi:hypothetical protein